METALAVNASSWCPGCGNGSYLLGVVPKVEADYETYAAL
jgi:pyruvate/2-oxoacid:ferredoxin oxidoreductase beta subunit